MVVGVAVALLVAPACRPQGPQRITIKGTATLDGEPIELGYATFVPTDPAVGATGGQIVNGVFSVAAFKGPHRVEITSPKLKRLSGGSDAGEYEVIRANILPSRYNAKTTLSFDLQSAKDQPKFELVSDAKGK